MKKILLTILFLVFLANEVFAGNIVDISNINTAKCVTEYDENSSFDDFDTITYGQYSKNNGDMVPIEWIILKKDDNKAFLCSKYILDCVSYNQTNDDVTWKGSFIRKWLNSDFFNKAFNESEKNSIISTHLNNKTNVLANEYRGNLLGKEYLSSEYFLTGDDCDDKMFLLSIEELNAYLPSTNNKLTWSINDNTDYYQYLNDSIKYISYWVRDVLVDKQDGSKHRGSIFTGNFLRSGYQGWSFNNGEHNVRPAMWVLYNQIGNANNAKESNLIAGMPQQESELRSDGRFYLNNNLQTSSWVYYTKYYYHVDGSGNIEKSKWIEQRYVGEDGRMYRGRQTPNGKYVGDDGLVVDDVDKDLKDSALIEEIQSDAWYKTQSGLWYYFENDRTTTRKGWFTDDRDGQTYYLDPSTGIMAVGWTEIDGDMYYFNENGGAEPNWYEVGDGIYESYGKQVKSLGSMYKNETTPDGQEVEEDGKLKKDDDIIEKDMMIDDDNYIIAILQYSDSNIFKIKSLDVICEKKQFLFFTIGSNYYLHIYLDNHMLDGCKEIIKKSVGNDVFLRINDEMIEMTSKNVSFDDKSMIIHYTKEEDAEKIKKKINDAINVMFLLIKNK